MDGVNITDSRPIVQPEIRAYRIAPPGAGDTGRVTLAEYRAA